MMPCDWVYANIARCEWMVEVMVALCALVHIATKHLEVQNCSIKYSTTLLQHREDENYIAPENAGYHCACKALLSLL